MANNCNITPQTAADLQRLLKEFCPEIARIRGDIRALAERITALEGAKAEK